ncbi:MAG: hypothetical protein R2738_04925 [Bacteroides graminisolvens]
MAPVSRLLPEISNPQEKKVLEGIQRNAMKINSLVHQVLDFSRIDGNANTFLILSHTEMVSFTRNQISNLTKNWPKRRTSRFVTKQTRRSCLSTLISSSGSPYFTTCFPMH